MEKNWEAFWMTGKVTDYLAYCDDKRHNCQDVQREQMSYGTISCVDGHSPKCYAYR
ncbi:MAG: hypothetical protein ACI4S2_06760 [Lachnospiraceae bacterium]